MNGCFYRAVALMCAAASLIVWIGAVPGHAAPQRRAFTPLHHKPRPPIPAMSLSAGALAKLPGDTAHSADTKSSSLIEATTVSS